MPHIAVHMMEGRDDAKKTALADALVRAAQEVLGVEEGAFSVSVEDVARADWMEAVFEPEIRARRDVLYRKPAYKEV